MNKNQKGYIHVSGVFLDQAIREEVNIFDRMIVVEARYDMMSDVWVFGGYHPAFRDLEQGCIAPSYTGVFVTGRNVPHWQESK